MAAVAACLTLLTAPVEAKQDGKVSGRWSGTMNMTGGMKVMGVPVGRTRTQARRTIDLRQEGKVLHMKITFHDFPRAGQQVIGESRGEIVSEKNRAGARVLTVAFGGSDFTHSQQGVVDQGTAGTGVKVRVSDARGRLKLTLRTDGKLGFDGSGSAQVTPEGVPVTVLLAHSRMTSRNTGLLDPDPN